jgi:TonB-dependent SusC/RagA subfamily outer membrane receptor
MRKILLILPVVSLFLLGSLAAQDRTISGKITSSEDGSSLPGVNVVVKGTTTGGVTDIDGNYKVSVPADGAILIFSFIGLETQEIAIGTRSVIDVVMISDVEQLSEVVVTALGVTREKASLGYATQEVGGEELTKARDVNFMNSLSGKVSGVQIKKSNQMGGSTNIVVRGYKSLTGNNQALFVVDGVIMSNAITNTTNQQTGRGGFDYGNAAMDINPDDIESVNILKGAAATALYGSRAANGVIAITTKKGAKGKGLGVTASFGTTFASIDESTFITYQNEYGAGYSAIQGWYASDAVPGDPDGYDYYDFGLGDGPQLSTAVYEDASFGPALDGTMAYDWRSFYPELSTYGQLLPQRASENDARTFYETGRTLNTNVSVQGGSDKANYRLSFTNVDQNGVLPNSNITRNTVSFAGGYDVNANRSDWSIWNWL